MTKEAYFEMCEQLGSEPVESEIPVEFDDFPLDVQQALNVYKFMRDDWDGMNGVYLGKSLIGISEIFEFCSIDTSDRNIVFQLIKIIDNIRQEDINSKKKSSSS
jgi:hypothetical protein